MYFVISKQILVDEINKILSHEIKITEPKKDTVVVDFSSPNIAKEMHVGHLRSTIMGETLCRILEFQGYDVRRINHLGDWGTQFGMLISYMKRKYPDYLNQQPNLRDLETFYKESKQLFNTDPEFKKISQQEVVKLQSGDKDCLNAWKILCKISESFYQQIYKRLYITINNYGESYYNEMIPAVLKELGEKNLIKEDKGAQCVFLPKEKVPLMVVKSDGGYNYDTTDIAAVRFRLLDWKAK